MTVGFKFPDFGLSQLKNIPFPPLPYKPLEQAKDYFAAIQAKDHLVHVPYQSYESTVLFFEKAATDPDVTHIKIRHLFFIGIKVIQYFKKNRFNF